MVGLKAIRGSLWRRVGLSCGAGLEGRLALTPGIFPYPPSQAMPRIILTDTRYPANSVDWAPTAKGVLADFPFGMQRDNTNPHACSGSKEFSGFKTAANAIEYLRW